jgi:hypothetical protein
MWVERFQYKEAAKIFWKTRTVEGKTVQVVGC